MNPNPKRHEAARRALLGRFEPVELEYLLKEVGMQLVLLEGRVAMARQRTLLQLAAWIRSSLQSAIEVHRRVGPERMDTIVRSKREWLQAESPEAVGWLPGISEPLRTERARARMLQTSLAALEQFQRSYAAENLTLDSISQLEAGTGLGRFEPFLEGGALDLMIERPKGKRTQLEDFEGIAAAEAAVRWERLRAEINQTKARDVLTPADMVLVASAFGLKKESNDVWRLRLRRARKPKQKNPLGPLRRSSRAR